MRWMWMALLLTFALQSAVAKEMWRWVDQRGVVHYSDRPQPGAERVELDPAQTYTAPRVEAVPADPETAPESGTQDTGSYSQLSIVSPEEGEMLWNIRGELNVRLRMEPGLREGHRLQVYLDEQRVADVPQSTQFTLDEVYRGEHRLRASIEDERGRELVSSGTVVFYVQQASLQNPNRPSPPRGPGG